MFDQQPPTLTEHEAARADALLARTRTFAWLMVSESQEEEPDIEALLAELVHRPAWHALANCRGADPNLFVPRRSPPLKRHSRLAQAYCADCEVRAQCLASALESPWSVGIWGGTTALGRKRLRSGVA